MKTKLRSPLWYELPLLFYVIGGIISFLVIREDDPVKAKRCLVLGIVLTAIPLLVFVGIFTIVGSNSTFVVTTDSMNPEFRVNDIVMVDDSHSFDSVNIGDIIVFNRPSDHDRTIVHRVTEILDENPKTLKTKGDANPGSIPGTDFPITESEYVGKVVDVAPNLGWIVHLLKPPLNYLPWIITLVALIVPVVLHLRFRRNNQQNVVLDDKK